MTHTPKSYSPIRTFCPTSPMPGIKVSMCPKKVFETSHPLCSQSIILVLGSPFLHRPGPYNCTTPCSHQDPSSTPKLPALTVCSPAQGQVLPKRKNFVFALLQMFVVQRKPNVAPAAAKSYVYPWHIISSLSHYPISLFNLIFPSILLSNFPISLRKHRPFYMNCNFPFHLILTFFPPASMELSPVLLIKSFLPIGHGFINDSSFFNFPFLNWLHLLL
jgi:hypothetical protein